MHEPHEERLDAHGIAAIVLAAGRSSRMGPQHKLLLPLGGRPLVAYAVAAACASHAAQVVVVLGHAAAQVGAALPVGRHQVAVNRAYADGMASSLHVGVRTLAPKTTGAVILLADQPLVTAALIDRLLAAARALPDAILATSYAGQRGNPVYFPRALFAELLAVTGDEGGRTVIARHRDLMQLVSAAHAEAALDVDAPGEYERLVAIWDELYPRIVAE